MNAVEIESLYYRPGRGFAIRDVSFGVPDGSVFGFLGANGSGKTTTIRLMLGLLRAERGSIVVRGKRIPKEAARALAEIGYVPESPHLYQGLTVEQSIHYHAGFYGTWDADLAQELVEKSRLAMDRQVKVLSKGERRKLMILLALAQRPRLLVLDEPTDGLDPVVRRDILDVLQTAVRDSNTTVFMSSHLVHELETVCDHIAVMDDGNIIASAPLDEFRNQFKCVTVTRPGGVTRNLPLDVLRSEPIPQFDHRWNWYTRGWDDEMRARLETGGTTVHKVTDLDLESGFVELLRSARESDGG